MLLVELQVNIEIVDKLRKFTYKSMLGWAAGYVTMKAGKMAATAIGGTLLLLQIAHHKGYVKVKSMV